MFDRYVVVDWSANSTPKLGRDSIWIAALDETGDVSVVNVATRSEAERRLVELFAADPVLTTLLGVDFSLGYPAGTASALGLAGTPWSAMWEMLADRICDDDRNGNNRFAVAGELNEQVSAGAGPFWGCPPSAANQHLTTTRPAPTEMPAQFRAAEGVLRSQGRRPFSSWQLLGAGAVGSQSLLGIPRLARLRRRFDNRVEVWPFTTGVGVPLLRDGVIVVAEVWPSMLDVDVTGTEVRDAAQVAATARWLAGAGAAGALGAMFCPALSPDVSEAAVVEEGWVLGVIP
jgi:precorrin-8X/cobalt-precorrin-8 methylmutase